MEDLCCNETMINDVENENFFVEYQSTDEKSTTSAGDQQLIQSGIAKLYSNAGPDPTFLKDRCLTNLLISQKRYKTPSCAYFKTIQIALTPQMRKIVAEWVIEVSFTILLLYCLTVSFVHCRRNEGSQQKLVITQVLCARLLLRFNSLLIASQAHRTLGSSTFRE